MGVKYRDGQNYPETYEDYVPPGAVARCMLEMMQYVYPVGSIYLSLNEDFDPNQAFGGTWELITNGKFLESTDTNPGTEIAAGLPNITGTYKHQWNDATGGGIITPMGNTGYFTGAFYNSHDGTAYYHPNATSSASNNHANRLHFDASRSNAIYGNSNTVQPPAITCYMWKRTA